MKTVMRLVKSCGISVIALCFLPAITLAQHYTQTNLASDGFVSTPVVDPNLSNPWGLTRSATGSPWWVANNNTGDFNAVLLYQRDCQQHWNDSDSTIA